MTDCLDTACPMKNRCRRWQPTSRDFKAFYAESPRDEQTCEEFWPKRAEEMN